MDGVGQEVLIRGIKRLTMAMFAIIEDPKSSRMHKILAAQIIAACAGVLVPGIDGGLLSTRQAVQLDMAKKEIAEKMLRRREVKALQNRRAYLRRKLREQQEGEHNEPKSTERGDCGVRSQNSTS